jgi:hypothetical protein
MAECVVWDQRAVRRRALVLLAVADRVKSEGWDDGVAVQLSRAAHELIAMANGGPAAVANEGDTRILGAEIASRS